MDLKTYASGTLRDILAYYKDPENVKAFEEWQASRKEKEKTKERNK